MDPLFVIPLVVLVLTIGIGVWQGRRHGTARGVKAAATTAIVGTVVLFAALAALTGLYYSGGGH